MAAVTLGTVNSGNQGVEAIYLGTVNSGNQVVHQAWIGTVNSGNQVIFTGLACSANAASGAGKSPVTTTGSTCTVAGGTGNFTYAWSLSSDGQGSETVNSPNAQTTTFTASVTSAGPRNLTATCNVTDTSTGLTASCTCAVTFTYNGAQS